MNEDFIIIVINMLVKQLNISVRLIRHWAVKFTAWSNNSYRLQPLEDLLKFTK